MREGSIIELPAFLESLIHVVWQDYRLDGLVVSAVHTYTSDIVSFYLLKLSESGRNHPNRVQPMLLIDSLSGSSVERLPGHLPNALEARFT